MAQMENKTASASAANDSGFSQINQGNDDDLEIEFGDGRKASGQITKASVSHRAASWLEFTDWLERGLDEYGLEPSLYARCVLSILKQPPEPSSDTSMEHDEQWIPTLPAPSLLSVVGHHSIRKNNSAPPSRKNSIGSAPSGIAASMAMRADLDARKQALLDCLKTINCDQAGLVKFVDDIVHRYSMVCKSGVVGEKQNESVDSGVCPSPEESFQNYDEAFPPLAADNSFDGSTMDVFVGEVVGIRPRVASSSWLNGKRPAEEGVSSANSRCDRSDALAGDGPKANNDQVTKEFVPFDGSPIKRAKLVATAVESDNGGRELHSCPDFVHSSSGNASTVGGKRVTFVCPVVKKQNGHQATASLKIPPRFVIPKCWKVGSWPSRYDRSTKPAGDVPFWSCSEWFCTVHKRLEFGMLNAKINGDTKTMIAPSAPPTISACCVSDRTSNVDAFTYAAGDKEVEIFEIEPHTPAQPQAEPQQQHILSHSLDPAEKCEKPQRQHVHMVPEMFDAQKFILHIINEDDSAIKQNLFPAQIRAAGYSPINNMENTTSEADWASFFDLSAADDMLYSSLQDVTDAQYSNDNSSSWAAPLAHSEFLFDVMDESGNIDMVSSAGILLPVDVSHLANSCVGGIGFCLPKCSGPPLVNLRQQQPQPQLLYPPASAAASVVANHNQTIESVANVAQKHQPQSAAVPIKDSTHFRPIRSESMEDAYYLKPGFDEFCTSVENIEEFYVYQRQSEDSSVNTSTTGATSPTALVAQAAAAQKKIGDQQRRSLPLKFRASKPDKMCQTEDLGSKPMEVEDVTTLLERYRQEFEIWAYQPCQLRNTVNLPRWELNESSDSNDGMVVGKLSPHMDEKWLDELVGGNTPPPLSSVEQQAATELGNGYGQNMGVPVVTQQVRNGQQQLEIWQQEDERYEDSLLRYVSNISLISPLDIQTTTV